MELKEYQLRHKNLKEEYSKVLHDETLKKFYILNEAYELGIKFYGKNNYSKIKLSKEFDTPYTTISRILSLRRANKDTWEKIKSGKLSSFKATQILLTKSNSFQGIITDMVIKGKLSTRDIRKIKKVDSLEKVKKFRLDKAMKENFARKSTATTSFLHYISQLSKILEIKQEDLVDTKLYLIKEHLIELKIKIDKYIEGIK